MNEAQREIGTSVSSGSQEVIEKVGIAIATGVTTIVVGALLTWFNSGSSLRKQLAVDSEILERSKPGTARKELKRSIEQRTIELVAITRFPRLARADVVPLLGVIVIASLYGLMVAALYGDGPYVDVWTGLVIYPAVATPLYAWLVGLWSARAASRVQFIRDHADDDALGREIRVFKSWTFVYLMLPVLVIAVTGFSIARWTVEHPSELWGWVPGASLLGATGSVMLALWSAYKKDLSMEEQAGITWNEKQRFTLMGQRVQQEREDRRLWQEAQAKEKQAATPGRPRWWSRLLGRSRQKGVGDDP